MQNNSFAAAYGKTSMVAVAAFLIFSVAQSAQAQPATSLPNTPTLAATSALLRPSELAARLKQGGYLIVMRHERTEIRSREDDYSKPLTDCLSQRNLSVAGYAGASETGEAIRIANVPIARVLSSPMCRTMETARAAFGTHIEPNANLAHPDPASASAMKAGRDATLALANSLQFGTGNIVFVTHQPNLFAFDVRLGEGETAVLSKDATGRWTVIGRASGSEWSGVARGVLAGPTAR
jgi:phosphohistidine phosphatase SixA